MSEGEIKKVVVLGPESTGKSTLCAQLAKHYNTLWCPEFAREYLQPKGGKYSYDDLLEVAKGQLALEKEYLDGVASRTSTGDGPRLLFVDTDMYVMKVWCEYVYGKCHTFILEKAAEQQADLYLLCNIDLPWTHDELREYPDVKARQELFAIYKDILINQSVPWTIISGDNEQRLQAALKAVEA